VAGHYCLQALLVWPDDANPYNNLGQKNTLVGKTQSPAQFTFAIHNQASVRRRFELEADMYVIPDLAPCPEQPPGGAPGRGGRPQSRLEESRAHWQEALRKQAYGLFPVTNAWQLSIQPTSFDLAPGETKNVDVSIQPRSTPFTGTQAFNIHGFATPPNGPRLLVGGVTLLVEGS
jgi:hypothetical protein